MGRMLSMGEIYAIRARYTSADNACRDDIGRLAHIAIAHDVASLVYEIERLAGEALKLSADVDYWKSKAEDK